MGTHGLSSFKYKSILHTILVVLVLVVHFSPVSGRLNVEDKIPDDDFLVYKSLSVVMTSVEPVLSQLRKVNIKEISKIYTQKECDRGRVEPISKRYPIILLEGMPLTGHKRILLQIATQLGATVIQNPGPYLTPLLRIMYACTPEEKTAIYALANYIAAMEIAREIKNRTVIITRYWYHTTAFAVALGARNVSCLPRLSSFIYEWPKDLVAPDISILLTAKMNTLKERIQFAPSEEMDESLVYTYLEMYHRFRHPKPILLPCEKPFGWIKGLILSKVLEASTPMRS